jgi:hypothetical protein
MASLAPDTISNDVKVEQYAKEAMNIVFSLPELTRDEQAARLSEAVKSGNSFITSELAEQAIDIARRTY